MTMLFDRELLESLYNKLNTGKGFTYWTTVSKQPTEGYLVGVQGLGWTFPFDATTPKEQVLATIAGYMSKNLLNGHAIGGWVENGIAYLDTCVLYADKLHAELLCLATGEQAYYDVGKQVVAYPLLTCDMDGTVKI